MFPFPPFLLFAPVPIHLFLPLCATTGATTRGPHSGQSAARNAPWWWPGDPTPPTAASKQTQGGPTAADLGPPRAPATALAGASRHGRARRAPPRGGVRGAWRATTRTARRRRRGAPLSAAGRAPAAGPSRRPAVRALTAVARSRAPPPPCPAPTDRHGVGRFPRRTLGPAAQGQAARGASKDVPRLGRHRRRAGKRVCPHQDMDTVRPAYGTRCPDPRLDFPPTATCTAAALAPSGPPVSHPPLAGLHAGPPPPA